MVKAALIERPPTSGLSLIGPVVLAYLLGQAETLHRRVLVAVAASRMIRVPSRMIRVP